MSFSYFCLITLIEVEKKNTGQIIQQTKQIQQIQQIQQLLEKTVEDHSSAKNNDPIQSIDTVVVGTQALVRRRANNT